MYKVYIQLFLTIGLILIITSCKHSDYHPCKNFDYYPKHIINSGDSLKILILGNSITNQGPIPELDWQSDWGMAASSQDKDYVHILYRYVRGRVNNNTELKIDNIAHFERNYEMYDSAYFETQFSKYYNFNPNLIIIRLGDNTDENNMDINLYIQKYKNLVIFFKKNRNPLIISTSSFFTKRKTDYCVQASCQET